MRFLLDEGLPLRLAAALEREGHDVTAIGRDYPNALADTDILTIAVRERRLLLTNDKDFGDLVFRNRLPHSGVVLFRLGYVPLGTRMDLLHRVLAEHAHALDRFIVVTPKGVRVGLPAPED